VQPLLDAAEAADAPIAAAATVAEVPYAPPLSDGQRELADNDQAQHSGAYVRISPTVHVSESEPWLRITGFLQHPVGIDVRRVQELYVLLTLVQLKPAAAAVVTARNKPRLQALALTITALLRWLSRWATTDHKQQRTSQRDLELLNSYEQGCLASRPFVVPSADRTIVVYMSEWVHCSLYVARLVLLSDGARASGEWTYIITSREPTNHI
jgi:hypothetical protein